MTRHHNPGPVFSAGFFLDMVERMDLGPLGALTCSEVTALAELMAADRGEDKATWVIVNHLVDSEDEEDEELAEHLADWPELADLLREVVTETHPIIILLNELENS